MKEKPVIVFLHGFGGTPADWDRTAAVLRGRFPGLPIVAPALPGHSGGGVIEEYSLPAMAASLGGSLPGGSSWILIGYSLGGRIAMHLARAFPKNVRSMALVSASPGIEDSAERALRIHADTELSRQLESCRTRPELIGFWKRWTAQPVFGGGRFPRTAASIEKRLAHDPALLARILRESSPGVSEWMLPWLMEFPKPLACFAGGIDAKYVEIANYIGRRIPAACVRILPQAAHALPADAPVPLGGLIADWLRAIEDEG